MMFSSGQWILGTYLKIYSGSKSNGRLVQHAKTFISNSSENDSFFHIAWFVQ